MVILLRGIDLNPDPRVEKYVEYYKKNNIVYKLVGWNRSNLKIVKENTIFYNLVAPYGLREKNLINRIKWTGFIIKTLYKERNNYKVIHACDFDTAIPAVIFKIFGKKVIFDVFDWIDKENSILTNIIYKLQVLSAKRSDCLIICDELRKKQMNINHNNIIVMPNIPDIEFEKYEYLNKKENICISYVGVFDSNRNIELLLEYVSLNKNITLNIAGFGALEDLVKQYSKEYNNIIFHGKVTYDEGLKIMYESDLIYAAYCTNIRNHIFAAPNKYYEALMLGKPIITTVGTLVGDKVKKYNTGFVIGETIEDIDSIFKNKDLKNDISKYSKNAEQLWQNKYKNYIKEFMENKYLPIIK